MPAYFATFNDQAIDNLHSFFHTRSTYVNLDYQLHNIIAIHYIIHTNFPFNCLPQLFTLLSLLHYTVPQMTKKNASASVMQIIMQFNSQFSHTSKTDVHVETHYYFIKSKCNNSTHGVEGETQKVHSAQRAA